MGLQKMFSTHKKESHTSSRRPFWVGAGVGMAFTLALVVGLSPILAPLAVSSIFWGGQVSPETKMREIYYILDQRSIFPFDRQVLMNHAFRGMLQGVGDTYTYYFDRDALAVFRERTSGTYAGVGMLVGLENQQVTVVRVFADSPAAEAGLQPGDKIVAVDGLSLDGKCLEKATTLVKGTPGTSVAVEVVRDGGAPFTLTMVRRQINVPSVSHKMLHTPDGLAMGYLRIESFEEGTFRQFSAAYLALRDAGMQGLVIDLRNNPGGLLASVIDIANLLLPEGAIMYSEDKQGHRIAYTSDAQRIDIPLVLLVNGMSASASEVLTGAVQDHGIGTVVGQQTFGKGIVQSLYPLSDGSAIKVTVARYYTPNGTSIHGIGITPDHIVEVDRETALNAARLSLEEDAKLQRGMEILVEKLN